MEKPQKVVEYVCLLCGAQGSGCMHEEILDPISGERSVFVCPKCGGPALYLREEREFFFGAESAAR